MFEVWLEAIDESKSILGLRNYGILRLRDYGITQFLLRLRQIYDLRLQLRI